MTRDNGLLDSGSVTILRVQSTEGSSLAGKWSLDPVATLPYQSRVVGYAHHYAAKSANQSVDVSVRVDFYPDLPLAIPDTVAELGGRYFRLLKITPTRNRDQLPVLDIDLSDDDAAIRRKLL